MTADLHTHTTRSDGRLSPSRLVSLAAQRGVRVLAITDHDSLEGIPEALEAAQGYPHLEIIPGVEMSADIPGSEVHILGYFLNHRDAAFAELLRSLRGERLERGQRMVAKLKELGLAIQWERVLEIAGDAAVGRPHVAQALLEQGYVSSIPEAFERYIGRNGPAYAEREKMTPQDVIHHLVKVGGVPVLAHPLSTVGYRELLDSLIAAGLAGMEVYYGTYLPEAVSSLAKLARAKGLIPCGGSDYHGLGNEYEGEIGRAYAPLEAVGRLRALAKAHQAHARAHPSPEGHRTPSSGA